MAPTAPPGPNAGLGLNLDLTGAMMVNLGGAGAATGPPTLRAAGMGGGSPTQLTTAATYYGAAVAVPGTADFDIADLFADNPAGALTWGEVLDGLEALGKYHKARVVHNK